MGEYRRRRFLVSGAALVFAPHVSAQRAQRPRRIGVMIPFAESDAVAQLQLAAFREELAKLGWVDGRSASFDYRWAGGDVERIRSGAKELVALQPDVTLVRTTPATRALRNETRTVPIVFVVVSDPVGDGLVESLGRPGGNITGFTNVESSFGSKWLELLREIFPRVTQVAVMYGPKTAPGGGSYYWRLVEDAARSIGTRATKVAVHAAADIERAIPALAGEKGIGLIVAPDVTTLSNYRLIISLAATHRVPAIYAWPAAPEAGGLMSYGVEYVDLYRRGAGYVDRILRGARPSELPIQQPTKFELIVNLRTAKTLGLSVTQNLLVRADRVIR
jgi:putative tryptophan/tyrosine transport system substrate-binding protein